MGRCSTIPENQEPSSDNQINEQATKKTPRNSRARKPKTEMTKYDFFWSLTESIRLSSNNVLFDKKLNDSLQDRITKSVNGIIQRQKVSKLEIKNLEEFGRLCSELPVFDKDGHADLVLPASSDSLNPREAITLFYPETELIKIFLRDLDPANEWIILGDMAKYPNDWWAVFRSLTSICSGRSGLFAQQMSSRIFNVCLPFGTLTKISDLEIIKNPEIAKILTPNDSSGSSKYLLIPVITLNADPKKTHFRNTISITLLLIPKSRIEGKGRIFCFNEILLTDESIFVLEDSPLRNFIVSGSRGTERDNEIQFVEEEKIVNNIPTTKTYSVNLTRCVISDLLQAIFKIILEGIGDQSIEPSHKELSERFSITKHATQCVLTPTLNEKELQAFYQNKTAQSLQRELNMVISKKHWSPILRIEEMVVVDRAHAFSNGLCFYNKQSSELTIFCSTNNENDKITPYEWAFYRFVNMSISMSLLDAMIHSFYRELETKEQQAEMLTRIETDLITDIDEFFDLDIKSPVYREMYQRMRKIDGVDSDFRMLKQKLGALKTNVVLDEQAKVNKRILDITGISVVIAIAAMIIVAVPDWFADKLFVGEITVIIVIAGFAIIMFFFRKDWFYWFEKMKVFIRKSKTRRGRNNKKSQRSSRNGLQNGRGLSD